MHRGQCYGANGGDAESHHNCGGSCRNSCIKTNPYQNETGYGGYTYNTNGAPHAHIATTDDDDTDDGVIYIPGPSAVKKQTHYFTAPTLSPELEEEPELPDVEEQIEQEHEEDYDEDIPPIDLSKTSSAISFVTKVETEQCVTAAGEPFTVTTIL